MGGSSWFQSFLKFPKLLQPFKVNSLELFLNITLKLADLKVALRSVYYHLSLVPVSEVISFILDLNCYTFNEEYQQFSSLIIFWVKEKKVMK